MDKSEKPIPPHIENKHTDDLIDHYWGSINYVAGLIKSSELKAGLLLSFYGILLNFIFQSKGNVLDKFSNDVLLYILLGLLFTCIGISIYFSVRCFIPRIEGKYDKNIFFFGDVISKYGNIKEFSKTFYNISINEKKLFEQLGEQVYINSKIAAWKFGNVNRAIRFLALSLLLLLLLAVYYLIFALIK